MMDDGAARALLRALFDAALDAARPERTLAAFLPPPARGRTLVVGAGKAAAAMAAALETAIEATWPRDARAPEGVVVVPYGHGAPTRHVRVVEAAHPVPDAAGRAVAWEIAALAEALGPDDRMIALVSGGGSALLVAPAPGVSLGDKRAVNRALLASGAPIDAMNCVRRHLSRIKGGRLAALAHPAPTVSLLISDVPGDDPGTIASGPTIGDPTTLADARAVLARHGITPSPGVLEALNDPANETPKPGDARLARATARVIATPHASLEAAADVARRAGITPLVLGDAIEGEAREVGRVLAGIALSARRHGQPVRPPCVILSGGETCVTLRGDGRGGRNVECLLGFVREMAKASGGAAGIHALMADTDGIDGAEPVAGAIAAPDTPARARERGLDIDDALARNDGHGFFEALGDQVVTGPTRTNVNDFRAVLIT